MSAYVDGRIGRHGGRIAAIKTLGDSPFGVFSLLCLLFANDSSSSVMTFIAFLTKKLSNVSCLCLRCKIFPEVHHNTIIENVYCPIYHLVSG